MWTNDPEEDTLSHLVKKKNEFLRKRKRGQGGSLSS